MDSVAVGLELLAEHTDRESLPVLTSPYSPLLSEHLLALLYHFNLTRHAVYLSITVRPLV